MEKARNLYLTKTLDAETTAAIIKRCRAEGVTVNSAFTDIANFATVDLLLSGASTRTCTVFVAYTSSMPVATLEGDTSQYLSRHIMLMNAILETPRHFDKDFWKYAKPVNEELRTKIKSGYVL